MAHLGIYTVDDQYVDALLPYAPHLFHNSTQQQAHSRKFLGVVLEIHGMDYFAPLSSFKEKHKRMKNGLDFIKIGDYAVINLNCMFPVPKGMYHKVAFSLEKDVRYRNLLRNEYRIIRQLEDRIIRNARSLYLYKVKHGNGTRLAERCNDFQSLEDLCRGYA